jgi:ABC-type uncharacterized transport system permease subunit
VILALTLGGVVIVGVFLAYAVMIVQIATDKTPLLGVAVFVATMAAVIAIALGYAQIVRWLGLI